MLILIPVFRKHELLFTIYLGIFAIVTFASSVVECYGHLPHIETSHPILLIIMLAIISILLLFIAWLVHKNHRRISFTLFCVAVIFIFMLAIRIYDYCLPRYNVDPLDVTDQVILERLHLKISV